MKFNCNVNTIISCIYLLVAFIIMVTACMCIRFAEVSIRAQRIKSNIAIVGEGDWSNAPMIHDGTNDYR